MSWPLASDPSLILCAVNELPPVAWLWPGWLALGKLSIFDGDPGRGKSRVALDLCARLTPAAPSPTVAPEPGPASAIILNAEDGPEDTITPRREALGAEQYLILLTCRDEKHQLELLTRFQAEGLDCRALLS